MTSQNTYWQFRPNGVFLDETRRVRIAWKLLGFSLAVIAFGMGLDLVLKFLNGGRPWYLPYHSGDALVAIGATWLALRLEGLPFASLGLRVDFWFLVYLLGGFAVGFLMLLLTVSPLLIRQGLGTATGVGTQVILAGLAATAGIAVFEELLFRGYVFQRLSQRLGPRSAQAMVALAFALPHLVGRQLSLTLRLMTVMNLVLVALFLGSLYLKTRSLAAGIGWHWAWNWALGHLLGLPVSGIHVESIRLTNFDALPTWLSGGRFGPEASLTFTGVGLAALYILVRWSGHPRPHVTSRQNEPRPSLLDVP